MSSKKIDRPIHASHTHGAQIGAVAGEALGAILGSGAGPAGVAAGLVIGAAAGALAGKVIDQEQDRVSRHDQDLDDDIGVTSGDLGRPSAPPAEAAAKK